MRRILPLGSLLVVLAAAPVAAQSPTTPTGGANVVAAANDFATTVWQDPWDMNQRTDLGSWLNSVDFPYAGWSGFNFAGGLFTGTVSSDPNVYLLETSHPGVASVGKFGAEYSIDANRYRVAAIRMRVPTNNYFLFLWGTNTLAQGITYSNAVLTTAEWRIYVVDLATLGILAGNEPWSGTKRYLRLDPAPDNEPAGGVVEIDWVRLVENQPSLARNLTWSGGGSVDIYLDNDQSAANGTLGLVAANVASYSLNVGALQPGDYYVAMRRAGTSNALSYSSGFYRVNTPATITVTSPSDEGSADDFATVQLNNPWDFTSMSDLDHLLNVQQYGIVTVPNVETEAGVPLGNITAFSGANTLGEFSPNPCQSYAKPALFPFHSHVRGLTRRIDPNRYRILTAELGLPNKQRDLCGGSIVRVVWHVAGDANETYSDDIILNSRAGANMLSRLNMDMATLEIEPGSPSQTGWIPGFSPNPGIMTFRIDPDEFYNPTAFFIKRLKLAARDTAHTSFNVQWTTSKTGGTINVYYDVDKNPSSKSLVGSATASALTGSLSWNTSGLPDGAEYFVYVEHNDGTNANGAYSKWPVVIDHTPNDARLVLNRSRLNFGVVAQTIKTPPQVLRLSVLNAPAGQPCWTASSDLPFLVVSPASGCGGASLTVSLTSGAIPSLGDYAGSIRITAPNASNSPQFVSVYASLKSSSTPPSGAVDTPANGAIVSGSIAVTGWAIDDIGVARVTICRSPISGESVPPNGSCGANQIYVGDAVSIDDARPDIETYSNTTPLNYRAGWGFLVLTNMLPNQGNGVFTLHMRAIDAEGQSGALGSRVIDVRNSTSGEPFGAIDTPAQGETIGGNNYANFGWVLSRVRRADPPGGGRVFVYIDGTAVGSPGGWNSRADLTQLFPGYPGIGTALGVFSFNTLAYSNGVHTIVWVVSDNAGVTSGVGSRFFSVFNAGNPLTEEASAGSAMRPAGPDLGRRVDELGGRAVAAAVGVREGFAPAAPIRSATLGIDGMRRVSTMERDRIEIHVNPRTNDMKTAGLAPASASRRAAEYAGYMVVDGTLRELPIGSSFDPSRGAFYWQPGLGYVGNYDLLFVRTGADGTRERIPVRVSLQDRPTMSASRLSGPWASVRFDR
jgi:hypothetical protein